MGDRITRTEWETLGTRTMTEIGVDHMRDKIETKEMIEALVTVDQDQFQEQLQIRIGSDVLSAEGMPFCEKMHNTSKQRGRTNPADV